MRFDWRLSAEIRETGKSTVARALAQEVGAQVISTDDVRRELRDSDVIGGSSGVPDSGLYSPDNVAAVYEAVLHRARLLVGNGRSVILDGTWRDPEMRARARRLAVQTHSAIVEFMCSVTVDMASERIVTGRPGNSEVTSEIAAPLAAAHNGWRTAHVIDTSREPEHVLRRAHDVWCQAVASRLGMADAPMCGQQ